MVQRIRADEPRIAAIDPKRKQGSERCMTAFRPQQKKIAEGERTEFGHGQHIRSGVFLQPQRLRRIIEHCLRILQIGGVEPIGEPAVDEANTLSLIDKNQIS